MRSDLCKWVTDVGQVAGEVWSTTHNYPRRARSALGVDTVLTLDVCMYVC